MKKELKRQIKQDDLATGYARATEWVSLRRDEVKVTLVVIAVIALGALGLRTYQRSRHEGAERAFAEALVIFEAPVATELPAGQAAPAGPLHATRQEKFQKSAAAFDGLASRYGSAPAGRRARYYASLSRLELGDFAEAEKGLKEVASSGSPASLEPALARMALAGAYHQRGQFDQAAEAYRKIVDDPASLLPRDHVLMRLGSVLEDARKLPEADASYKRLVEEYPTSAYASEARQRRDVLAHSRQG